MSASVHSPVVQPREVRPAVPEPERKGPARWKLLAIAAVVVVLGWLGYRQWVKQTAAPSAAVPAFRTAKAVQGVLQRTLRVSGQTSARNYASITIPLLRGPDSRDNLTLLTLAKSGSLVRKGDLILSVDTQTAQDHIDDVTDMVRQAHNDIEKRRAEQAIEWDQLQQSLRVAKADLDGWTLEAGAIELRTPIDKELIELQVEESAARYKQLQEDLASKKIAHAAELRILEITSERQERHLDRHVTDIKRLTIHAPMDGLAVMESIWRGQEMAQVQEGDLVTPGQRIMKIVDPTNMQIEGTVNQAEIGDLRVGAPAHIGVDAFPGAKFKGKVYSIGALATGSWRAGNYVRNVPVKVVIDGSDPRVIPDLSAWADVIVEQKDDATIVPLSAIQNEDGQSFVLVKSGMGFAKRPVKVGLANTTHAAITEGVNPGDEVRIN